MAQPYDFPALVALCNNTHHVLQTQAGRVIDNHLAVRNWLFGCYIVEYEQSGADRAAYGQRLIRKLAEVLTQRIGKGFAKRSLEQARQFYLTYREVLTESGIAQMVSAQSLSAYSPPPTAAIFQALPLGWSHYVALLSIDNIAERRFYELETAANHWSVRELERQIESSLYERLAMSRNKEEIWRLASEGQVVEKAADLIKNPLILEFLELEEKTSYTEADLESGIIAHLQSFLLELGKGFLFEARQKRLSFDNDHFYVDLVFYNRLLRCYVLIDLKRGTLTHQDLGQMQMYVNYFDRYIKMDDELPTVGIVLCHRKNDALVELTLSEDTNIFATKYQLYLPSRAELKAKLEEIEATLTTTQA